MKFQYLLIIVIFIGLGCNSDPQTDEFKYDCSDSFELYMKHFTFDFSNPPNNPPQIIISDNENRIIYQTDFYYNHSNIINVDYDCEAVNLSIIIEIILNGKQHFEIYSIQNFSFFDISLPTNEEDISHGESQLIMLKDEPVYAMNTSIESDFERSESFCSFIFNFPKPNPPFFMSYSVSSEPFYRYYFKEEVGNSSTDTFNSIEGIPMYDPLEIKYPSNNGVREQIFGIDDHEYPIKIHGGVFYTFEQPITEVYAPEELFDKYKVNTLLRDGNYSYIRNLITDSIPTDFILPDLEFEIIDKNISNYQIESISEYKFFALRISRDNSLENFSFDWDIMGTSKEIINGELYEFIFNIMSDRSIHFTKENMELKEIELYNASDEIIYEEYIHRKLGITPNEDNLMIQKEEILKVKM